MERQEEEEQCSEEPTPFCEDIQVLHSYMYIYAYKTGVTHICIGGQNG